jgi:hypothetical protein
MKNREKQGRNQKQSAHEDVTAVSPMKKAQSYIVTSFWA